MKSSFLNMYIAEKNTHKQVEVLEVLVLMLELDTMNLLTGQSTKYVTFPIRAR